ncbi:hypothetical protein J437_LFUL012429 [Ladona fulva]|uniref:YqaJ viral recombinase domain-containing protein n=1 Tax=Ladona fulva TaxID=123851 RepID=A0A8K0P721_LADFU|nr:hypothetical protein J437_LFUL012429 [Ladona fulva]
MEADIIVEGFKSSVAMHGLKYAKSIGDGDSSVMNRLAKAMPYSIELVVEKIECSNHILRNYCKKLHPLALKSSNSQGPVPLILSKKLQIALPRLRSAVTGAIKFRSRQLQESNIKVTPAGLFIDEDKPYLAATPDGLIGEDGVVEIKCPYSLEKMSPAEGIASGRIEYCIMKDGHLILKKNHDYMYQIQGQLHITRRKFCIFALWSPKGMLTQTIEKDGSFWSNSMESKLEKFYMECLLPEIIERRYPRGLTIKEPNRVFN